jgi:hypothetical protein
VKDDRSDRLPQLLRPQNVRGWLFCFLVVLVHHGFVSVRQIS